MRQKTGYLLLGILLGAALFSGGAARAAGELFTAALSTQTVCLDGQEVALQAYLIGGSNYVKLRDIGKLVGFNVYWDGAVQIDSAAPYTGQPAGASQELDTVRQEMTRRINQVRREYGVPELTVNAALMAAAQDCSAQGFTSHNTQYECQAALSSGYAYGVGVNLTVFTGAATDEIAGRAVTNWVNSPGHLLTMTDAGGENLGVGVTVVDGVAYCYMLVGDPSTHNPYEEN